jgi:hypothetical protein
MAALMIAGLSVGVGIRPVCLDLTSGVCPPNLSATSTLGLPRRAKTRSFLRP